MTGIERRIGKKSMMEFWGDLKTIAVSFLRRLPPIPDVCMKADGAVTSFTGFPGLVKNFSKKYSDPFSERSARIAYMANEERASAASYHE